MSRWLAVLIVEYAFNSIVMSIFMEDAANDDSTGAPPLPGGADYVKLFDRVMECLGSRTNEAYFVFAHYDINHVNYCLMRGMNPISRDNVRLKAASFSLDGTVDLLTTLRACLDMLRYLDSTGTPNVNQSLTDVVNNVGDQWNHGQAVWNAANPNNQVFIGDFWSEWVQDYYPHIIITDARASAVLNVLGSLESQLGTFAINTAGMN
ncbi:hypothetical protein PTTW11_10992 [Pyrenophora teres f. teres]|uniref:Uncharacterized protein n=1 Tax=Pyrenophora teres f. teres TaxID=97479 RepID=A0A6S6WF16_9PLEO|nr:hypothetical protein PTNB29_09994 [Pyrenophora teres f. teres]CAE7218123.1 hypothetical protein PTTW11_10992 [Pyrenophora teres f. teres]